MAAKRAIGTLTGALAAIGAAVYYLTGTSASAAPSTWTPRGTPDLRRTASTFTPTPHYTPGRSQRPNIVVIHTAEVGKTDTVAETLARAMGASTREASAHYFVDRDSVVQSVNEGDTAWHAPGVNERGIGIEHAGYAKQTASEWGDAYNRAMLALSARVSAEIADRWGIPVRRLTVEQVRAGESGFASHNDVSKAFGRSNHWDPGPNFPWAWYLSQVTLNQSAPFADRPIA